MPALSLSHRATRDFDHVRQQVESLMSQFNTSVMEVVYKYHELTMDSFSAELNTVKGKLAEQQRELDYRSGVILRLEKEKIDMRTEMESRILEARKIASFERLELRPTCPTPTYIFASQVESEPETLPAYQSRDLESVISRLKKQKNPRQVTRRRHTETASAPAAAAAAKSRSADSSSVLEQAAVPDLISSVQEERDSTVTVTESILEIKEESLDVDDNYVPVLAAKEVQKPATPLPTSDSGIDTVDDAVPSTSSRGCRLSARSSSSSASSRGSNSETREQPMDGVSDGSREASHSDTSSDAEKATNNNDATFVNRHDSENSQLSLPLKKRKPQAKKKPEKAEKLKPAKKPQRTVKSVSTDSRSSVESRVSSVESRVSSAPSVAISEDEITPMPDSTTTVSVADIIGKQKRANKRKRKSSLDQLGELGPMVDLPPRRCTQVAKNTENDSESELDDSEHDPDFNPKQCEEDCDDQILEIGIVHASNTPILAARQTNVVVGVVQPRKQRKATNDAQAKPTKVKRSRSLSTPRIKVESSSPQVDGAQCQENFTDKAEFRRRSTNKKRKLTAPATAVTVVADAATALKLESVDDDGTGSDAASTPAAAHGAKASTSAGSAARRTPAGPYQCDRCPAVFKWKYCLDNHRAVHTQDHPHKCAQCSASFRNEQALSVHAAVHNNNASPAPPNPEKFQCKKCKTKFAEQDALASHIATTHPAPAAKSRKQALKCDHCEKNFSTAEEMAEHIKLHKGDRLWKCGVCPSTFRWKGSLDMHVARHRNAQSPDAEAIACAECEFVCGGGEELVAHVTAQHGAKL